MSIKISYKKGFNDKIVKNYVLFSNEKFSVNGLNKIKLVNKKNEINKTIETNKHKKREFISFNINSKQKIILIKTKHNHTSSENEKLGASFYNFIKSNFLTNLTFLETNINNTQIKNKTFIDEFLHGIQLKSYEFNKYKTKKETTDIHINVVFNKKIPSKNKSNRFSSLVEGTNFTKDLVSEPGNILHPDEYAKEYLN